jgi:hypothetical protein
MRINGYVTGDLIRLSNHEFMDISDCDHPFLIRATFVCLVCGQDLSNIKGIKKKYREISKIVDEFGGGHNHR